MQTAEWGPGVWKFLHSISFNYPEKPTQQDIDRHIQFFIVFGELMPCKQCRDSYKIFLQLIPIQNYLDSRAGLIYWVYQIHDKVNQKLDKGSISFKTMVRNYELIRATCKDNYNRKNIGNFGKCLNPATNQINEEELDKFVNDTLQKYEYISNNKCTDIRVDPSNNLQKNYANIAILILSILFICYTLHNKI
jgi:hypothetical protein